MTTIYIKEDTKLPKRKKYDEYATPKNLIKAVIPLYVDFSPETILDVGAGDGRWGAITRGIVGAEYVAGVEIQDKPKPEGFDGWYCPQDFLTFEHRKKYDLVLSNPPYKFAEAMIRKSWEMLKPNGCMMFLLSLLFQAGQDRYHGLWQELSPSIVAVSSRRPSFYGGGTNGTDYGVYIWYKGKDGKNAKSCERAWITELFMWDKDEEDV